MSDAVAEGVEMRPQYGCADLLLQLPGPALRQVVQKLDSCSLACTAVTSSRLNRTVLAQLSKVEVRCSSQQKLDTFVAGLQRHSTSLTNLSECSIVGDPQGLQDRPHLRDLPRLQLRQLHLERLQLQLGPAGGYPGVLHDCSGLTALHLHFCDVEDVPAAAAAIAALTGLQRLRLKGDRDQQQSMQLWAKLQLPLQLTHLSMNCQHTHRAPLNALSTLDQLSQLTQLQYLQLAFSSPRIQGGVPYQLVKLTYLGLRMLGVASDYVAEQLQHLSSLTALQQLSLEARTLTAQHVSGIQHLSQLTGLELILHGALEFSTSRWAPLTALQRLMLQQCTIQPAALSGLTQLKALSLAYVTLAPAIHFGELLAAVSPLTLLTELVLRPCFPRFHSEIFPAADAYTALTASTNLCSLQLGSVNNPERSCTLFKPGASFPKLREVGLSQHQGDAHMTLSEQQLQQMCSSCPALESLAFVPCDTTTCLLPLLQLTALTRLQAHELHGANIAAVAHVVTQLTGLKQLAMSGCNELPDAVLLQLATPTLTALKELDLNYQSFRSTACWGNPSDVHRQLAAFLEERRLAVREFARLFD